MVKEHTHTSKNDFIGVWYMEDNSVCDLMIDFYKNNNRLAGYGTIGPENDLNKKRKDSIDLHMRQFGEVEPLVSYKKQLFKVLEEYKTKYKRCDYGQHKWGLYEDWNIQEYKPGGGYHEWHYEKGGAPSGVVFKRHLVFMTFLNDITEDGGETEWLYQKIKIKPEKGLTVIWPAEWPWTHRGVMCEKQAKYIATGWYSFKDN